MANVVVSSEMWEDIILTATWPPDDDAPGDEIGPSTGTRTFSALAPLRRTTMLR